MRASRSTTLALRWIVMYARQRREFRQPDPRVVDLEQPLLVKRPNRCNCLQLPAADLRVRVELDRRRDGRITELGTESECPSDVPLGELPGRLGFG